MVPAGLYARLAVFAVSAGAILGFHFLYSQHYIKQGVVKCEAATAKLNAATVPITDTLTDTKDAADDEYENKKETIRTETRTGISALDLARAQREAQNTGEELGRARALAEYRSQGGCMSAPLPADDGLLIVGQNQQRAIFGYVIGGPKDPEADPLRGDTEGYPLP